MLDDIDDFRRDTFLSLFRCEVERWVVANRHMARYPEQFAKFNTKDRIRRNLHYLRDLLMLYKEQIDRELFGGGVR